MKRVMALSLVAILLVAVLNVPVLETAEDEFPLTKMYRDDAYALQQEMAQVYFEIQQGRKAQSIYEHVLQLTERVAVLLGEGGLAFQEMDEKEMEERIQGSLQDCMEIFLILGLSEQRKSELQNVGYTEEDLSRMREWILEYNDWYHHASSGLSSQEREQLYGMGLTDDEISEVEASVRTHYSEIHTTTETLQQQQTELLYTEVSLSALALKLLEEGNQGKNGKEDRLQEAERDLLTVMEKGFEDQSSLEHVRASSKQVYKAAEQRIRKGDHRYSVDFFVGMQVYCGAVTALSGDGELGSRQIVRFKDVLAECAASSERPAVQRMTASTNQEESLKMPLSSGIVGEVEESNEANNMGVAVALVKTPETSLLSFLMLVFATVSPEAWQEVTLPSLSEALESLLTAQTITVSSLASGAFGALFLFLIWIPPVSASEWPDAVIGNIRGNRVVIVVEGSYGQGHITKRSQDEDPCIRSSHQAILDNPYKINKVVKKAQKLLYQPTSGKYGFVFKPLLRREWVVIIREYSPGTAIYELVTAFRADCGPPYLLKDGEKVIGEFQKYYELMLAQEYKLI
jgi:hypothetical protein